MIKLNLNNFNFLNKIQNTSNNIQEFLNQLENYLNNNSILENDIYIIRDTNNEKLSLVNLQNGNDLNIYVSTSQEKTKELNSVGIYDNIYEIKISDFYNLKLGMGINIKNNTIIPIHKEIKLEDIKNSLAFSKLEDMYFCLSEENGNIYSVEKIYNDKIYLTNIKSGGFFSIPVQKYPNFKIGDLVQNYNGNYYKKQ